MKQHHLTLPESADLAQNRPLWRMMSTYGATHSYARFYKLGLTRKLTNLRVGVIPEFNLGLTFVCFINIF